jgi:hypothetical protein
VTEQVRLYLDIDGVVNADAPLWGDSATVTVKENHGAGYISLHQVTFSPEMVQTLDSLRGEFDFELVILSTWLEDALISKLVGKIHALDGGRWLPIPRRAGRAQELPYRWKLDALRTDMRDDNSPFIWIDDDEVGLHSAEVRASIAAPALLIAPNPVHGLNRTHLAEIREFLVEQAGS